jgi:uncharacterized membrane protein YhaH (DUF805 family)
MDWGNLLFSYTGRINRAKYWLAILIYVVVSIVAQVIGLATGSEGLTMMLSAVANLFSFVSGILVGIKRLHDRDKSGWLLLLFYIAPGVLLAIGIVIGFLGVAGDSSGGSAIGAVLSLAGVAILIWAFVELGCLRGTVGPNQYGPDPLAQQAVAVR